MAWPARIIVALGVVFCLLAGGVTAETGAAQAAGPSAHAAATSLSIPGELYGVAALSASDAWAVGFSGTTGAKTLILHWNGRSWTQVTSPKPVTGGLNAISAVSANNIWAVGSTVNLPSGTNERTLVMHWNGKSWRRDTSVPTLPGDLDSVVASGSNVWAGGSIRGGVPLVLRRTSGHWYLVPTDGPQKIAFNALAVTGPNSAWAGGTVLVTPHFFHWNGSVWKPVSFPLQGAGNTLSGMAAGPGGTAWAVGSFVNQTTAKGTPASMHWNDKTWRNVPIPAPTDSALLGVGSVPGGTAWAVGWDDFTALIMRWAGSA
jgi:hypothetical protein